MRTTERAPTETAVERAPLPGRGLERSVAEQILAHQATAGNQAVVRMLQRDEAAAAAVDEQSEQTKKAEQLFDRGAKSYDQKGFGHAYDFFIRSHELAPLPDILFSAAQALRRGGGRREEAIALYERYLASGGTTRKKDAESFIAELRGAAKTGDPEVDKPAAEKLFDQGEAHYNAGRFGHAYDAFIHSYVLFEHPDILFSAAQALRRLGGRRAEACALYERYLATGGTTRRKDAEGFVAELRGPAKSGDAEVDKKAAETLFDQGEAHYNAGRFGHAYDAFMQSYGLFDHPDILFSAAQALRRLGGRGQEALALYERYLSTGGTTRKKDAGEFVAKLRDEGAAP